MLAHKTNGLSANKVQPHIFILLFQGVAEEGAERVEMYSDDDEEYTSPEEGSDSEPMLDDQPPSRRLLAGGRKGRGLGSSKSSRLTSAGNEAAAARQRNLKQKFVALLKKFKVTDPEDLEQEQASLDQKLSGTTSAASNVTTTLASIIVYFGFSEGTVDPADIEDLFDQLEDFSDSGPDADTISIGSTPKPSLKPFFCSSRNLLHEARSVAAVAAAAKAQSKH